MEKNLLRIGFRTPPLVGGSGSRALMATPVTPTLTSLTMAVPSQPTPACPRPAHRSGTTPHLETLGVSRRSVMGGMMGLGAASLTLGSGAAKGQGKNGAPPMVRDELVTLMHHATQGFTLDELARAEAMGYGAWLDEQLDPASIDDSAMDQILAGLPNLPLSAQEIWNINGPPNNTTAGLLRELRSATILRSMMSKRQLYERLVEFWSDHFNILQNEDSLQRILKMVDDRTAVRANVLTAQGTFHDLLLANAQGASMSYYLDNYASKAGSINENYARELMELHTLGVSGPYTETDVTEVARCFTGWAFLPPQSGSLGDFVFIPNRHDNGAKTVLGQTIPAGGGINDGLTVLSILATHPSTVRRISRKLASWLLRVDPPSSVMLRVENAYRSTGGNIRAMVSAILQPETFLEAAPWKEPKLKRPFHLLVSLLRQTEPQFSNMVGVINALAAMGHAPHDWHTPDGAPDRIESWGGDVLNRWTLASYLLSNQLPGVTVPNSSIGMILGGVPQSQVVRRLDQVLCGGTMRSEDRDLLQSYVDGLSSWNVTSAREAIALAASSPSYQLY